MSEKFNPKYKTGDSVEILYDYHKDYPEYPRRYFGEIDKVSPINMTFPYVIKGIDIAFAESELKLID